MSVAESIEILPPIDQVGWFRAASTVTELRLVAGLTAEGTTTGGQYERVDLVWLRAVHALCQCRVLAVDGGIDARPAGVGSCKADRATCDEALLVRERDVDPAIRALRA